MTLIHKPNTKYYLNKLRLKTLPLVFSCVFYLQAMKIILQ